ncbi:MAG TPA: tetratricopeptide repeat protein [Methylomirabilota bacterium]|nr:tetratricopeptide repeat protein [Methylomirabilota bacterium]
MAVKIFYCYAHEDKKLRAELEKHLGILKQQKLITEWSDRDINAGAEWAKEVDSNLNTANIILLLISTDFVNSEYCYSIEMKRALERHKNGTARVIPIILRHVDHEGALFSHLQALPTDKIPITDRKWRNRDEAFLDVSKGIRKVVKELLCEQWLEEGNIHFYRQQYSEALEAFEQAICLDHTNALAFIGKGQTLIHLASNSEDDLLIDEHSYYASALTAFEQAISLDATIAIAYEGKARAFFGTSWWGKEKEILEIFEQAIFLAPKNESVYIGQGEAFMRFAHYNDALVAYEKAIEVAPFPNYGAYRGREEALIRLQRYEDALATCELSIQKFPNNNGYSYCNKGEALYKLKRYQEALAAYNKAFSLGIKSAPCYVTLGDILCQLFDYQKALDAYEQAIHLDYDFADAHESKGTLLTLLAEEAFRTAKKIRPF